MKDIRSLVVVSFSSSSSMGDASSSLLILSLEAGWGDMIVYVVLIGEMKM